ncbi:hypothetical protein E2C01_091416 [Portunus trituberculatus]|uniref:Uncharacterized protein n=1 Tax=Portunus trituberculatus TaxID=210409 RepID=A0A5B7JUZ1_PORTR|nr:hypothetical protein [Portunus trituberculatus]
MSFNGTRKEEKKTSMGLFDGRGKIMKTKEEKDLGMIIQENLNPKKKKRYWD